ncbi:methyl-accepting chemotaxis protein [Breznakibacter xylanolyticus]|uniref:Methyl-accepting chemotaxis protein n=1 Tax=Breznakibacter xylanolyticus TaxID=990 RepID=A0A2W7NBZ5_9BACT|nr:methyl-accepting chemotaxis protein [Breznakibacter xylanolyticus]
MPSIITDHCNGDFNAIKSNLNNLITAINTIIEKARLVANGDLTVTLTKRSENDDLMEALNDMVAQLNTIVLQIMETAQNVSTGSG